MDEKHEIYMQKAINEAKKAYLKDEVPVGAVVVRAGKIISRGHTTRDKDKKITKHAELIAIEKANKKMGDWRLNDCVMYITNDPCPMCAGAIQQSRMSEIYVGAKSPKHHDLVQMILNNDNLNHTVKVYYGIKSSACEELLNAFFKKKRIKK